jgi:hypothetical protein
LENPNVHKNNVIEEISYFDYQEYRLLLHKKIRYSHNHHPKIQTRNCL